MAAHLLVERRTATLVDRRADIGPHHPGTQPEQCIFRLLRRLTGINPWNRPVIESGYAAIAPHFHSLFKEPEDISIHVCRRKNPASVGQPLMRVQNHVGGNIGGEHRHKSASFTDHPGTVRETIRVIVHVTAHEQECSVARTGHKPIPFLPVRGAISFNNPVSHGFIKT